MCYCYRFTNHRKFCWSLTTVWYCNSNWLIERENLPGNKTSSLRGTDSHIQLGPSRTVKTKLWVCPSVITKWLRVITTNLKLLHPQENMQKMTSYKYHSKLASKYACVTEHLYTQINRFLDFHVHIHTGVAHMKCNHGICDCSVYPKLHLFSFCIFIHTRWSFLKTSPVCVRHPCSYTIHSTTSTSI